jgi:hypothetical protein
MSVGKQRGAPAPLLGISSAGAHQSFERRFSMILSEHVSGKVSRGGLFAVAVLILLALPHWSLGQAETPLEPEPPAAQATLTEASSEQPGDPAAAPVTPPAVAPLSAELVKPLQAASPIASVDAPSSQFEDRLQKIEATLQLILERLKAVDAKGVPIPAELANLAADGRVYTLQSQQGRVSIGAIDNQSGKLLWRSELPEVLKERETANWRLESSGDKKLIQVKGTSAAGTLTHTIDAATGQHVQISVEGRGATTRIAPAPQPPVINPQPAQNVIERLPQAVTPYVPAEEATVPPEAPPPTSALPSALSRYPSIRPGVSSTTNPATQASMPPPLDLVTMATTYIDALGKLKLAEVKYEGLREAAKKAPGSISKSELDAAAITEETARQKVALLASIAKASLESAQAELQHAEQLYQKGYGTQSQVMATRSRVQMLKSILGQSSSSTSSSSSSSSSSTSEGLPGAINR